jgi:Do/DeqQ family serine protease
METNSKGKSSKVYWYAALIALGVSLGVLGLSSVFMKGPIILTKVESTSERPVLFTADKEGNITPLDFTQTADKVLDGVVHITSRGRQTNREYRQLPDPFRDFFRNNPFGPYFESPEEDSREGGAERQSQLPAIGTGSGVIINTDGYIVTNNHVIDQAEEIEVTLHNNGTYKASVVGVDPTTDIALLKIEAKDLKALAFVNSDDVEVGEWVLAIGNPFSLNSTVTAGIVSAKARNININREELAVESFIQTDAAINPGNSGGALVNLNGDLIGINTAIASRTGSYSGYGFAVPSNIVSKVVQDLLEFGNVQRGILGVRIQNMDGRLAKEKGISLISGAYVAMVNSQSAADEAGIEPGDIITGVNGKEIDSSPRLQEIIAGFRPGDKVSVDVNREGVKKTFEVTLKNTSGDTSMVKREESELWNRLGADFQTLDSEKAAKLELDGGVEITRLYPGKLRQETQIREGFIITKVNGDEVKTLEAFQDKLTDLKDGGVMLQGRYPDSSRTYYYAFGLNF